MKSTARKNRKNSRANLLEKLLTKSLPPSLKKMLAKLRAIPLSVPLPLSLPSAPSQMSLIAFCAGALNALAFAPLGWWLLAPLTYATLFALWVKSDRPLRCAGYGFAFGVGMFGVGISWIYVSLNNFGGLAPWLAALCVLFLVLAMALLPALAGFLQARFFARAVKQNIVARALLILPSIWLLVEWLRGWLLTGFPWLTSGYAMIDTPIAGLAPLGGVYLVGLVTLVSGGALLPLLFVAGAWSKQQLLKNLRWFVPLGLVWLGGGLLAGENGGWTQWTRPHGTPIEVAIVQNNVSLRDKWAPVARARIIDEYLAQSARHREVDVVVWPEAAIPQYLHLLPFDFHRQLLSHPADFIFGVLTQNPYAQSFNSIIAISGGTQLKLEGVSAEAAASASAAAQAGGEDVRAQSSLYHKQHLVPFGEFMPLKAVFQPLFARLNIPMSNFTAWRAPQAPLRAAGHDFAASICYEDAFPQIWRAQVARAGVLLNVSEDIWFGDSFAPHQRLQMARFRALETARPMIRASNNGLSSFIDWRGARQAVAPQFVKTVLVGEVQPRTGVTPYTRYGNFPALLISILLLLAGHLLGRRNIL